MEGKRLIINEYSHPASTQNAQEKGILIHSKSNNKPPRGGMGGTVIAMGWMVG